MLFNSLNFLLLFLPVTAAGFWACRRWGNINWVFAWLTLCSATFYGAWEPGYIVLLAATIAGNYAAGRAIDQTHSRAVLGLAIAANLAVLGFFKYTNLLLQTANALLGTTFEPVAILLPLGISFITFIQIAFLVDVYRRESDDLGFPKFALFVSYFPHLIAGPIIHHKNVMSQFTNERLRAVSQDDVVTGLVLIVIGLLKKVLLADGLATLANPIFRLSAEGQPLGFFDAWGSVLCFTLQIYFDFSGYSDIAIGLSRLFGVRLPLNFNSPYKSLSIIDFWRRWHITLSHFLRDYLYIPLGGGHRGTFRRYLNLMIVMLLGGLWHGASWLFVVWGGLHGFYLIVNHAFRYVARSDGPLPPRFGRVIAVVGTALVFPAVIAAWVFFRAESWGSAMAIFHAMAGGNGIAMPAKNLAAFGPLRDLVVQIFHVTVGPILIKSQVNALLPIAIGVVFLMPNSQELLAKFSPSLDKVTPPDGWLYRLLALRINAASAVTMALAALAALMEIYKGLPSEFIYFQF